MLIIPAVELKDGRCARPAPARAGGAKAYDGDPVEVAKRFEGAGARMLHVVDLDDEAAGPNSKSRKAARRVIRAVEIPVQFAGGVRGVADVQQLIEYGAAQVVIGALAAESPETLEKFVQLFGFRVCVGIAARRGSVVFADGRERGAAKLSAVELARRAADAGVDRVVYAEVSRERASARRFDLGQTCAIARESGLRVTASGAVTSLADIKRLRTIRRCGVDSVIVCDALYNGRLTLREALRAA
ncbi:MAG TPA: HisA/HisF-related TIM barrel protein [Pyrinomonadaceae bacterium]|nr:HisA/HisF-related TIM barrel protein [Pyrinomonadaceae bacterium]